MKKLPYIALSIVILLADQISKWFVTEHMIRPRVTGDQSASSNGFMDWLSARWGDGLRETSEALLPYIEIPTLPFFNIVMVWNHGVSFGMFSNSANTGAIVLSILAVIITVWFGLWLFMTRSKMQAIAIAMVIGGALGNVIDRVRFGAVIDFLDFHIMDWHYPAFNIADSAVVLGVLTLIVYSVFFEKTLS